MWFEFIGFAAGLLTTISFVPQVLRVWRTKSVDGISPLMYILFCLGLLFWLIYGIFLKSPSMILANFVTLILAGTVLIYTLKNRK